MNIKIIAFCVTLVVFSSTAMQNTISLRYFNEELNSIRREEKSIDIFFNECENGFDHVSRLKDLLEMDIIYEHTTVPELEKTHTYLSNLYLQLKLTYLSATKFGQEQYYSYKKAENSLDWYNFSKSILSPVCILTTINRFVTHNCGYLGLIPYITAEMSMHATFWTSFYKIFNVSKTINHQLKYIRQVVALKNNIDITQELLLVKNREITNAITYLSNPDN